MRDAHARRDDAPMQVIAVSNTDPVRAHRIAVARSLTVALLLMVGRARARVAQRRHPARQRASSPTAGRARSRSPAGIAVWGFAIVLPAPCS